MTTFKATASCAALLATISLAQAQAQPKSGFYQITSGTYYVCCGFAGEETVRLPSASQAFIALSVEGTTATMTFLSRDLRPGFPRLTNGVVSGNTIRFHYQTSHAYYPIVTEPAFVDYTVTHDAGSLWISGSITSAPVCCDIPTVFEHRQVQAMLQPALTIRVSEVELCWNSESNQTYQVQYRSDLTTNLWTNLGAPVMGNGATNCVLDKVPFGQPQKYYRTLILP